MNEPVDIRTRMPLVEPPGEENEGPSAEDILKKCLEHADTIDQVLVLTVDNNGVLAFLGNCEGLAESLLFMELIKAQAIFSRVESPSGGNGGSSVMVYSENLTSATHSACVEASSPLFVPMHKIARYSRVCTITEKIDGTNASVFISDDLNVFLTASRTRWITPEQDNNGFSRWAHQHKDELMQLGAGYHFGEWWGNGIQRKYNQACKRFSLFNTNRWKDERPACCDIVPVLYEGMFTQTAVEAAIETLRANGSVAAPGFMQPEGIVIYHHAAKCFF